MLVLWLVFGLATCSLAEEFDSFQLPTVEVSGKDLSPVRQDSIFKAEKVRKEAFQDPSRQSLADLVKDQVGVDAQVYCANCGAKRLTINGLKGEHTSILVDGIPLHSAVSSFYGVDSIPILGLKEVEVMRGAGASLTNPEAIGGTLNLITVDPLDMKNEYSTSVGVDDRFHGKSQNHSVIFGNRSQDKTKGYALGGQFSEMQTWDVDQNNVAEMPQRQNYNLFGKGRWLSGTKHDTSLRVGYSNLEVLGGFWKPRKPGDVRENAAVESDFEDGSVERRYLGDPETITDWINIERKEVGGTGTYYVDGKTTLEWKLGYARQHQKAIYQHGFDYANIDNLFVGDVHIHRALEDSIGKLGLFVKDQKMRSESQNLFERYPSSDARDIAKDNFNFLSLAAYGQWSWYATEDIELDFAIRYDRISMNWLELTNEIQQDVIAPRFQYLQNFNEHWSQRFSYGLGYRAPLTFFESQHGNNENGYEVDITDIEKAHSYVYSMSYNVPDGYVTGGVHYTRLENMAFGFESQGNPIFYRNDPAKYDLYNFDLLFGYKPMEPLLVELVFEKFQYPRGYKRNLPTAAIEERFQFRSTYSKGKFSHSLFVNAIGRRHLSEYGRYNEHFVDRNITFEPDLDPNLEKKDQTAPPFFTLDTSMSYELKKSFVLSFGVNNVFNYTQAGSGDSPSTWHWHFDHAHYDGLHTWGPNQGRQYFARVSGEF